MVRPSTTRAAAALTGLLAFVVLISDSFAWREWAPGDTGHPAEAEFHAASQPSAIGRGSFVLELASYRAGEAPAQRLTLAVNAGDPELYRVTLTYPAGFSVRGFQTTGASAAGSFEIDVDADGTPERTWVLRPLASRTAFADALADGAYSPDFEPAVTLTDATVEVRLPLGGDIDPATFTAAGSARLSLVLAHGVIANPALGGRHIATATLLTVDPETDGADDGMGAAPVRRDFDVPIAIDGPRPVQFAALTVRDFDVFLHGRQADRFELEGRFALGWRSDGIDPLHEDITVTVGNFTQTIPGGALTRTGYGYRFKGRPPGIVALTIRRDGLFIVETRRLQWDIERRTPVRMALEIGDDMGSTYAVDRRRRHLGW